MVVNFYTSFDDKRKVNKLLNTITSLQALVKDESSLNAPTFVLSQSSLTNISRCNYCYCSVFNRYYFINNIKQMKGQCIEVYAKCDVLMSFNSEIRALSGMIVRQENITNPFIIDERIPVRTKRVISYKSVGNIGNESGIALTVNAG